MGGVFLIQFKAVMRNKKRALTPMAGNMYLTLVSWQSDTKTAGGCEVQSFKLTEHHIHSSVSVGWFCRPSQNLRISLRFIQ
jgi:hypothetical protein